MATDLIRIIGVGNPLMGDDGVGIKVIELLHQQELPKSVELIDGGCGGLKLLPLLSGCRKLIIVDAADFSAPPGRVRTVTNADLHLLPPAAKQSGHDISLPELLQTAQKLQQLSPLLLYLVQVKSCRPNTNLTAEINLTPTILVEAITANLRR